MDLFYLYSSPYSTHGVHRNIRSLLHRSNCFIRSLLHRSNYFIRSLLNRSNYFIRSLLHRSNYFIRSLLHRSNYFILTGGQITEDDKYVFFFRTECVFSQFHPSEFTDEEGRKFNCMEQYMHYHKAGEMSSSLFLLMFIWLVVSVCCFKLSLF